VNTDEVKVVSSGKDYDAGVIFGLDLNGNYKFAADSPDSYHGPDITGTLSRSGVKDLDGTSEPVYKQGCDTGEVTDDYINVSDDMIITRHDDGFGDSGGPYWVERNGDSLMIGIHHGHDSTGQSYATIMASIESDFNHTV
jgi:hypothetical protein